MYINKLIQVTSLSRISGAKLSLIELLVLGE